MKLHILLFAVALVAAACSSNNDNIPMTADPDTTIGDDTMTSDGITSSDDTMASDGTTTDNGIASELLPSIFKAANLIDAESHFRLLVTALNDKR